ncbi:hypothetical protein GCM10010326_22130 [Streptomyces xanthochromogenes]|uniref:Uncharacterized protein n=1 Tax=Streptomyces xanthochromogenes TaxID=67384 RepID=A0ABQ2ZZ61_9ACTN|nr:hypothetical protein GCM10010326_22130 [Streptomyces xanthochromogenes]
MGLRREETRDIFDHHQSGLQDFKGAGDVQPQAGPGAGCDTGHEAGEREIGAREPGDSDIDGLSRGEVDGGQVAEVGHLGPVMREDRRGARVDLGVPCDRPAEHLGHGHVEAAVPRAHAADPGTGGAHCSAPTKRA